MIDFQLKLISEYHKKIPNIKQPTLVLWGNEDLLIPLENAKRFQQDLPNNNLVILKNTGHVPMEENPIISLEIFEQFLNQE